MRLSVHINRDINFNYRLQPVSIQKQTDIIQNMENENGLLNLNLGVEVGPASTRASLFNLIGLVRRGPKVDTNTKVQYGDTSCTGQRNNDESIIPDTDLRGVSLPKLRTHRVLDEHIQAHQESSRSCDIQSRFTNMQGSSGTGTSDLDLHKATCMAIISRSDVSCTSSDIADLISTCSTKDYRKRCSRDAHRNQGNNFYVVKSSKTNKKNRRGTVESTATDGATCAIQDYFITTRKYSTGKDTTEESTLSEEFDATIQPCNGKELISFGFTSLIATSALVNRVKAFVVKDLTKSSMDGNLLVDWCKKEDEDDSPEGLNGEVFCQEEEIDRQEPSAETEQNDDRFTIQTQKMKRVSSITVFDDDFNDEFDDYNAEEFSVSGAIEKIKMEQRLSNLTIFEEGEDEFAEDNGNQLMW